MREFMLFMVIWIIFFSLFYKVAGVEFDAGDYQQLNTFFIDLIQSYRNSIGDIAPPEYPIWIEYVESGDPDLEL